MGSLYVNNVYLANGEILPNEDYKEYTDTEISNLDNSLRLYIDNQDDLKLDKTGGTISGSLTLSNQTENRILSLDANKEIVSDLYSSANGSLNSIARRTSIGGLNILNKFTLSHNNGTFDIKTGGHSGRGLIDFNIYGTNQSSPGVLWIRRNDNSDIIMEIQTNNGAERVSISKTLRLNQLASNSWIGLDNSSNVISKNEPVLSFNSRTGNVNLSSQDVKDALGYTPAQNEIIEEGGTYIPNVLDLFDILFGDLNLKYRRIGNMCFVRGNFTIQSNNVGGYVTLSLPYDIPGVLGDFTSITGSVKEFQGDTVGIIQSQLTFGEDLCAHIYMTKTVSAYTVCVIDFSVFC